MELFKSKVTPGHSSAPRHRTLPHFRAFKWACLIGLALVGGCSTVDTKNTSERPWNRPTKADVSAGWLPGLDQQHWDGPGNHYP